MSILEGRVTTENKKCAEQITDMLNSYTFDYEGFCRAMARQHKTLQQSFTRLCIDWIKTCAEENYPTDGRNEMSHKMAKKLLEDYPEDELYLPMI